jgi:putative salt-induced outer membrane protein YdiY
MRGETVKLLGYALLAVLLFGATAQADVVTLKNGDRLTGTLVTVKGGNLELKSEVLGSPTTPLALTIPLAQVASFSAEKPAVVVQGQKTVEGQLVLQPSGDWQVTEKGQSQTVPAANVDLILPADAYHALVEHKAKLWQDWHGTSSLGYAIQRGDQQTSNFSATVAAIRERPATPIFQRHWRTNYNLTTLLSHATENGTEISSNTFSTGFRQDYLFTPRSFLFGFAQIDHVGPQGLYLRQTYGGGYGYDLISTSRTVFSLLGGLDYVHEKFVTGDSNSAAEALAGEKLGIQFTKRVRLDHNLNFYPNLSDTGRYRFDTATTLSAQLVNKFSVNVGVIDLYLSNPAAGSKKNNVAFTTGLGYTF